MKIKVLCVILVLIALSIEACVSAITPNAQLQSVEITATPRTTTPTVIDQSTMTVLLSTVTPIQPEQAIFVTQTTAKPTSTPTSTRVLPTPTSAPTLTHDEATQKVLDLIQNNAECRLPCWWGFIPGKTSLSTIQYTLASLGEILEEYDFIPQGGYVEIEISSHNMQMAQYYLTSDDIVDMIWVGASTTVVRDDFIVYYDPVFSQDWQRYLLPNLFEEYGPPSEILLRTMASAPEKQDVGHVRFSLLVFYPQKGILIQYEGNNVVNRDQITICPQKTSISLWLWSSEVEMTLNDVYNRGPRYALGNLSGFRSIEEVTDMDIEAFYQVFTNADQSTCFDTPTNLWP